MSLIIKDKIRMLIKGYPTVSDKYNVSGAILEGSAPVQFGELVVKSGQTSNGNYFSAVGTSITSINDIGGFVLGTNIKVAENWPGTLVQVNPGEAFNLLINGFMAVELDPNIITTSAEGNIVANKQAATYLTGTSVGKITYSGATSSDSKTAVDLPNVVFTGIYEEIGGKIFAEIYVK